MDMNWVNYVKTKLDEAGAKGYKLASRGELPKGTRITRMEEEEWHSFDEENPLWVEDLSLGKRNAHGWIELACTRWIVGNRRLLQTEGAREIYEINYMRQTDSNQESMHFFLDEELAHLTQAGDIEYDFRHAKKLPVPPGGHYTRHEIDQIEDKFLNAWREAILKNYGLSRGDSLPAKEVIDPLVEKVVKLIQDMQ